MVEWILVGMMCATAIMVIAHTIDEAVLCARPLRPQSHRCPGSGPLDNEKASSRVQPGDDEKARKRAA